MLISLSYFLFNSNTSSLKDSGKFNLKAFLEIPNPTLFQGLRSLKLWSSGCGSYCLSTFCSDLHGHFKPTLLYFCHGWDMEIFSAEIWVWTKPHQALCPFFLRSLGPARKLLDNSLFSKYQHPSVLSAGTVRRLMPSFPQVFRLLETMQKALQQKPWKHLKRWKGKIENEKRKFKKKM